VWTRPRRQVHAGRLAGWPEECLPLRCRCDAISCVPIGRPAREAGGVDAASS
jgi:hypothetical protein